MGIRTGKTAEKAYQRLIDMGASWLKYVTAQSAAMSKPTNTQVLHGIEVQTRRNIEEITQLRDTDGIILAAKKIEGDDTYTVKADIGGVINAASSVIVACQAAVSKDKDGLLLVDTADPKGGRIPVLLSATDVAAVKVALDALAVTLKD